MPKFEQPATRPPTCAERDLAAKTTSNFEQPSTRHPTKRETDLAARVFGDDRAAPKSEMKSRPGHKGSRND